MTELSREGDTWCNVRHLCRITFVMWVTQIVILILLLRILLKETT